MTAPQPLDERERALMLEVQRHLAHGGVAPSYATLASALGLASRGGVHRMLRQLQRKGWIAFGRVARRSIVLLAHVPLPPAVEIASLIRDMAAVAPAVDGLVRVAVPATRIADALRAVDTLAGGAPT